MKYIILILVAGLIIFVKPWRMSLEESIFSPAEDTTLLSSTLSSDSLMLFPANQVINNNDSELDITLKFDRIIRKFMQKWEIKGASFVYLFSANPIQDRSWFPSLSIWNQPLPMKKKTSPWMSCMFSG